MSGMFTVERSQRINASSNEVFEKIVDLHEWEHWSPWVALDPNMTTTYSGEAGMVGSGSHWSGNRRVGEGQMMVTAVDEPHSIDVDLTFIKPFKAENKVRLHVEESEGASNVTWTMTGANTFMTKVMGLFGKTMDKMVGPDFEKGLASLKRVVES